METLRETTEQETDRKTSLRELRRSKGISQVKLAELLDVAQPTVSEAERTGKGLGMGKWLQVSEIFDTDLRQILHVPS